MTTMTKPATPDSSLSRKSLRKAAADPTESWDLLVIGGGSTGLATAWDAVSRGLRVALLERSDFAKSTTSRSTKLVHGGVRYLQKGEISLVKEALKERKLLLENAPEFAQPSQKRCPAGSRLSDRCADDLAVQQVALELHQQIRFRCAAIDAHLRHVQARFVAHR